MKLRLFAAVALLCGSFMLSAQVAVSPIVNPHQTFVDVTGSPCAGCSLYSYTAGTTTSTPTYTDSTGGVQNTNPIVLSVQGGANIWVNTAVSYKFVLKSPLGVTIWSVDNVESPAGQDSNNIVAFPLGSQTITQPAGTDLNILTSSGGLLKYNGQEVATASGSILKVPPDNQAIIQPAVGGVQTTLHVSSLNGALDVATCGLTPSPSWCSGTDIGAWINAAAAALPLGYSGYRTGDIILPPTNSMVWSTPAVIGPGTNLIGQGKAASNFTCTVSNGACLTHDASATTGVYAHSTQSTTKISGFAIRGNGATGQDIFYLKDAQGVYVSDAVFDGATVGSCVHMRDINWWTERNTFVDVSTGYSCGKGWRFSNDPASPYEPHPSFGYNRFLDIKANPNGAQKAFSFENDVYMYASTFRATVNKEGVGAIVFHMEGGAEFYNNETHIFGEEQGTGGAFLDITSATNILAYMGEIYFPNQVNNIHAGATLLHSVDDGGFGPPIPVTSQRGYIATTAVVIPMGDDLNNYTNCGTYEGNSLLNAPTFVGTNPITIENICSNDPRYVTQIAHLMTFTPHTPRVWVRIKDFGTWGSWVEQAFANPGQTGFLTSGPIAAGTCNVLTATVAGAQSGSTPVVTPAYSLPVTTILQVGLIWSTSYVSALNTVTVPVCNITASPITPAISPVFSVRVIQ